MYAKKSLNPTPIDLYAARCAVLHTLTPYSDLSEENKARYVTYAWGDAKVENLEKSIDYLEFDQTTSVHLNDLFSSFKTGVGYFLETDGIKVECQKRMSKHFSQMSKGVIEAFNSKMA